MSSTEYIGEYQQKITDLENFLKIHIKDNNVVYNLNETIHLNVSKDRIMTHTLNTDAFWPLISYKLYGTTRLAWLLMKLNDVKPANIFDIKRAQEKILYLSTDDIQYIVESMNRNG